MTTDTLTTNTALSVADRHPDLARGDAHPGSGALARAGARARARGAAMRHLASEVGQGTVEYVGLLLLMATILAAIVAGAKGLGGDDKIGKKVVEQVGNSIDKAGSGR